MCFFILNDQFICAKRSAKSFWWRRLLTERYTYYISFLFHFSCIWIQKIKIHFSDSKRLYWNKMKMVKSWFLTVLMILIEVIMSNGSLWLVFLLSYHLSLIIKKKVNRKRMTSLGNRKSRWYERKKLIISLNRCGVHHYQSIKRAGVMNLYRSICIWSQTN